MIISHIVPKDKLSPLNIPNSLQNGPPFQPNSTPNFSKQVPVAVQTMDLPAASNLSRTRHALKPTLFPMSPLRFLEKHSLYNEPEF